MSAAVVYFALVQTVAVPLIPTLTSELDTSLVVVSWLVTTILLVGAVVTPIFGRLADMYGRVPILVTAVVIMSVGSVVCALTDNIYLIIVGRGLQGCGSAIMPVAVAILREILPPQKVTTTVAMLSSAIGFGAALGIPVAAAIAHFYSWQLLFVLIAVLGVVVSATVMWATRGLGLSAPGGHFDIPGAVALTTGLTALLLAITQSSSWDAGLITALAGGAVVVLGGFVVYQRRIADPLVDMSVMMQRAVLLPNVLALLLGFSFYANSLLTTQLLQAPVSSPRGFGLSLLAAGAVQSVASVAMIVMPPLAGKLTNASGARFSMIVGSVVLCVGFMVHTIGSTSVVVVVTALAIVAAGTAICYSSIPIVVMNAVSSAQMGAANGINVLLRTVGQTVNSAMVAAVLAAYAVAVVDSTGATVMTASSAGFTTAYAIAATGSVLCVVCSLALKSPRLRDGEVQ